MVCSKQMLLVERRGLPIILKLGDCDISLAKRQRQRPRRLSHIIASSVTCLHNTQELQTVDDFIWDNDAALPT